VKTEWAILTKTECMCTVSQLKWPTVFTCNFHVCQPIFIIFGNNIQQLEAAGEPRTHCKCTQEAEMQSSLHKVTERILCECRKI